MCGLAALVSPSESLNPDLIRSMGSLVAHRGPDDDGYAAFSGQDLTVDHSAGISSQSGSAQVALGHRRLSIIDLTAAGHQPMGDATGRLWIVFNGEIYNYRALRAELESRGREFRSNTDTEAILAAYAEWGPECLSRLRGMFAFVLVDRAKRRLFAARDRFGIKPLYYWISPSGLLALGSEIKQFTTLPGWSARANGQRSYDFLAWGVLDHTDETLFAGVRQFAPGECLTLRLDGSERFEPGARLPTRRWYAMTPQAFRGSFDDAAQGLRERFLAAVEEHLQADVPVGSCLSGGLDSSAVVCAVRDLLSGAGPRIQRAFSARAEDPGVDEGRYIDIVLRATGIEGHSTVPQLAGLFDVLDAMTWHQDEPFGSTSIYAQWRVFELAARKGVKVMLDGQGADEQLAGYHSYFGPRYADLLRSGQPLELLREMRAVRARHGYGMGWSLRMLANALLPEPLRQPARRLSGNSSASPGWLDPDRLGAAAVDPLAPVPGSVNALSLAQLSQSNLQMLLHWEDRDSMAHSVEARVPFLDHRLVEFVLGLPDAFKLHRGETKRVFREAMKGVLPEPIRSRTDKLGFATPEEIWMLRREPEMFRQRLERAVEQARGVLRPSALSLFDSMRAGHAGFSFIPWRMISFGTWVERFEVAV